MHPIMHSVHDLKYVGVSQSQVLHPIRLIGSTRLLSQLAKAVTFTTIDM